MLICWRLVGVYTFRDFADTLVNGPSRTRQLVTSRSYQWTTADIDVDDSYIACIRVTPAPESVIVYGDVFCFEANVDDDGFVCLGDSPLLPNFMTRASIRFIGRNATVSVTSVQTSPDVYAASTMLPNDDVAIGSDGAYVLKFPNVELVHRERDVVWQHRDNGRAIALETHRIVDKYMTSG